MLTEDDFVDKGREKLVDGFYQCESRVFPSARRQETIVMNLPNDLEALIIADSIKQSKSSVGDLYGCNLLSRDRGLTEPVCWSTQENKADRHWGTPYTFFNGFCGHHICKGSNSSTSLALSGLDDSSATQIGFVIAICPGL